jgi:hypothetical protein
MEKKTENDRMRQLVKAFEKKDEIFVDKKENVNEELLSSEYKRLKALGSGKLNADFKENYGISNDFGLGGQGMTVNSMANNMYDNSPVAFKAIKQPLKTEEALAIAIKRTIESGAPVNNLDFYDEVNLNLTNLGFPSRLPLDIKAKLVSMIVKDKE